MQLSLNTIRPVHAEDLFALYQRVMKAAPYGHLAEKSISEFETILSEEAASIAIGAWCEGRLVGYTLCLPQDCEVHLGSPLMRHVQSSRETLYLGKGTAVDPEFQGKQIMMQLLKERWRLLRCREIPHFVGLTAVTNLRSLVNLLRVGHWLAGLERDDYCENFVTYLGECTRSLETVDEVRLPCDELQELRFRFDSGWVASGINKNGGEHELLLCRVPALEKIGV